MTVIRTWLILFFSQHGEDDCVNSFECGASRGTGKTRKRDGGGFDDGRNHKIPEIVGTLKRSVCVWGGVAEKKLLLVSFRGEVWSRRGHSRSAQRCPQHLHSGLVTWAEVPAALPLTQPGKR